MAYGIFWPHLSNGARRVPGLAVFPAELASTSMLLNVKPWEVVGTVRAVPVRL